MDVGETFYASWNGLQGKWIVTEVVVSSCAAVFEEYFENDDIYVSQGPLEVTMDVRVKLIGTEGELPAQKKLPKVRCSLPKGK